MPHSYEEQYMLAPLESHTACAESGAVSHTNKRDTEKHYSRSCVPGISITVANLMCLTMDGHMPVGDHTLSVRTRASPLGWHIQAAALRGYRNRTARWIPLS